MNEKLYVGVDIEKVKAEYFDENAVEAPPEIRRVNIKGQRFYAEISESGIEYKPSHTTVLSSQSKTPYALIKWQIDNGEEYCKWFMENSANYGTYMHAVYAQIITGKAYPFDTNLIQNHMMEFCIDNDMDYNETARWYKKQKRDIRKDVYSFLCFVKERDVKAIAIEIPLTVADFAGVVDMVCEMTFNKKTITAVIDFKSSLKGVFYEDNEVQLYAQKILVEKCLGLSVDNLFNFSPVNFRDIKSDSKKYNLKNQTNSENGFKWHHYLAMYRKTMPEIETEKMDFFDGHVSLETDLDEIVKVYNIEDLF